MEKDFTKNEKDENSYYQDICRVFEAGEREAKIRELEEAVKHFEKIYNKSSSKKAIPTRNKKNSNSKVKPSEIVKESAILIASLLVSSNLILAVGPKLGDASTKFAQTIINYFNLKDIKNDVKENARNNLKKYELGYYDEKNNEFIIKDNTIEDYEKLDLNDPYDVWPYYLVFKETPEAKKDDSEIYDEFDKLIQSTTYSNGLYHYTGTKQFLEIGGYHNFDTYCNYQEAKALEENDITSSYANKTDGVDIEYTNSKGRR